MRNVLVTGGTGFVGSNLASALVQRGCNVKILRRENSNLLAIQGVDVEHIIGDVRDAQSVERAMHGCDTVFHTAAIVTFLRKHRDEQWDVNVGGTRNVVYACLKRGAERLVHTSSVAAVGFPSDGQQATEETEFNWGRIPGYKFSKFSAEKEVLKGIQEGLHAVIVNPSVIVGERDIHFHGGQLIRDIKRGLIPFYIDGGMNVVYVGDVVRGHLLAAEKGRSGERYILGGENLTHKHIFKQTARLIGGRGPFAKLPIPLLRTGAIVLERAASLVGSEPLVSRDLVAGAGRFNWYSSDKAKRELGYTITPFDTTILKAYQWYTEQGLL